MSIETPHGRPRHEYNIEQNVQYRQMAGEIFIDLTNLWLGLKGRYHFENLSRQGDMSSESYRANFSKSFNFKGV